MDDLDKSFLQKNKLQFVDIIGKGGYGVIFLVFSPQYSRQFALKKVQSKRFRQAEIDCLKVIDDQNIVSLYQYYYYGEFVYMLMEFCPSTVEKVVKQRSFIDGPDLLNYTQSILKGLKACHDRNISHNDIKPSNFLIDQYGRVKVGDFGLSCIHEENELSELYAGSLAFVAPEILNKKPFDPFKADIWSLGVTFFYIATGQLPWRAITKEDLIECISNGIVDYSLLSNRKYATFVMHCLRPDPATRPTIDQLLNSPIFAPQKNQAPKSVFLKPGKAGVLTQSLTRLGKVIMKPTRVGSTNNAALLKSCIHLKV